MSSAQGSLHFPWVSTFYEFISNNLLKKREISFYGYFVKKITFLLKFPFLDDIKDEV